MKKKKNLLSVVYFLCFIAIIGSFYSFTTKAISQYNEQKPQWENLKVLPQDISKDSMEQLMKSYSISLGVKCSYCHAPQKDNPQRLDFADDSKMTKDITRGMISMTDEINEKYFQPHYPDPKPHQVYDVSCVTCHRGTAKPKAYLEGIGNLYSKKETEEKN